MRALGYALMGLVMNAAKLRETMAAAGR